MNNTITKAVDTAIDNIVTSGGIGYCDGEGPNGLREDIITCGDGYAWYPDSGEPQDFTKDDWVVAALMKDGRICLVDGAGDWELVEGDNVGAQGIAALQDLVPSMPEDDKYEYQRDYLDDYVRDAKRVWLNSLLDRLAKEDYEPYVEVDEELSDAATKAYEEDDEESILYILDHIDDVVDILGRL